MFHIYSSRFLFSQRGERADGPEGFFIPNLPLPSGSAFFGSQPQLCQNEVRPTSTGAKRKRQKTRLSTRVETSESEHDIDSEAGLTESTNQVTLSEEDDTLLCHLLEDLNSQPPFEAGQLRHRIDCWRTLTSDRLLLHIVEGFTLDFTQSPFQRKWPTQVISETAEVVATSALLQELLDKGVIEQAPINPTGFVSNIFLRRKRSGSFRLILNLRRLNEFVEYHHFKMDHLNSVVTLISKNDVFCSLDLADAYYSINVAQHHRKYFQFVFNDKSYRFTSLAMGISSAPRTFTKLLKVPLAHLRERFNVNITAYLDDLLLIGKSVREVLHATIITQRLLRSLGYFVSIQKSTLVPTRSIEFLGFCLDSSKMLVSLPAEKCSSIRGLVSNTLLQSRMTIREFAQVLGKLTATLPANRYGGIFLKRLEMAKTLALQKSCFDFNGPIALSAEVKVDLRWWHDNIATASRPIVPCSHQMELYTDASSQGWGCYIPLSGSKFGGRWTWEESQRDINYLELRAVLLSLQATAEETRGIHILIHSDNTTTVVSINKQGSTHSRTCNNVAREIWLWAMKLDNWVSATYCPGSINSQADDASRMFRDSTEWMLNPRIFRQVCRKLGSPSIDLFASRLNKQLPIYCAWQPDPGATAIDCFKTDWGSFNLIYAFPPFSLAGRVLQKINTECNQAIVILPCWPSQPWYTLLRQMLLLDPVRLPVDEDTLHLPHNPNLAHPLQGRLVLWACLVCGRTIDG